MFFRHCLALVTSATVAVAQVKGFNYGSTNTDGSPRSQSDFTTQFNTAANLVGGSGFTSARLYTTIQAGTASDYTSAIAAAMSTKTSLLLGLWASAGQTNIDNEITALTAAAAKFGTAFTDLVIGISVGSEDLYRISATGIANNAGVGAGPDVLVSYISQVRNAIKSTSLSNKLVGHVDTWTAYVNGSNSALISACDFLGVDAYPYFETTLTNSIDNGKTQFFNAYDATVAVAQGKQVWVTETGWPLSGPTANLAVPSVANAKTYWDQVGCSLFGSVNTWWYTLYDGTPSPSFGITGNTLSTTPAFDLTCPAVSSSSSSSSMSQSTGASSMASGVLGGSSATATGTMISTASGPSVMSSSGANMGASSVNMNGPSAATSTTVVTVGASSAATNVAGASTSTVVVGGGGSTASAKTSAAQTTPTVVQSNTSSSILPQSLLTLLFLWTLISRCQI